MAKVYYWLKLKNDFFRNKEIKKLRNIAGGDTYTIIYLKMQLLSIKDEGVIIYEGTEKDLAEQLALELDEKIEDIKLTLSFMQTNRLLEQLDEETFLMNKVPELIGKETDSAERMRKMRNKVTPLLQDVTQSKSKELELEKEKELENINTLVEKIKDLYNDTCTNLSNIKTLSKKRTSHIKQREKTLKDFDADWGQYFVIVNNSQFLTGKAKTSVKWKANFDWLINESNMIKVLEGNYSQKSGFEAQIDIGKEWLAEREANNA